MADLSFATTMNTYKLVKNLVPPTAMQVGLLVENELAEIRGINVEQVLGDFGETFNRILFDAAWNHVIEEFDIFQMGLRRGNLGAVEAVFEPVAKFSCGFYDWSEKSADEQDDLFYQQVEQQRAKGIEVDKAPAMRVDCFFVSSSRWRLLWTFHHSLLDGFSYFLVLNRLFNVYDAFCQGQTPITKSQSRYQGFLEWLAKQDHEIGKTFFHELLEGFEKPTPLPFSGRNLHCKDLTGGEVIARLSRTDTSKLQLSAKKLGATPNTVVQLCWGLLLSKYSGELDVVFGATWAGRSADYSESSQIAGMLMNTTPVRVRMNSEQTVRQAIELLRAQHGRIKGLQHTPLASIRTVSDLPKDQPLFNSVVVFDYQRFEARLQSIGDTWTQRSFQLKSMTGVPLTVCAHFVDDRLTVEIEYREGVLTEKQAMGLVQNYLRLLRNVTEHPDATLKNVRMLSDSMFQKLVTDQVQREGSARPADIVDLILHSAKQRPDATAVESYDGSTMTFSELERASRGELPPNF
ncbi:MAG: hypothetical protein GY847_17845 [Proteobacteria bacterium]|nr:hypothetical protein [Pseudomonadota bacterium]